MSLLRHLFVIFGPLLLSLCALIPPFAAFAQEDWADEVVVRGRAAVGPALWRVSDDDSQVIIIGVLPVFPKKQAWKTTRIENALRGANALITPPDNSTGPGDVWSLMRNKVLPDRGKLKDALPGELYARYEATARRAGVPIKDFAKDKPVWAGARLRREVLQKHGLSENEPLTTIKRLARTAGVSSRAVGRYDSGPLFKAVNAMSEEASQACLRYTLDDIDFDMERAPRAAQAWSVGDIATLRSLYQGSVLMKCLSGSPMATATLNRSITDSVSAVSEALNKPGKTVAVLPLGQLLRKGGVLEKLRARGYRVSAPQD
ncbi:TraB/GumN family protein [Asticcacaulis excentricus]|uniref:GumN family protein n=1 Tax=Asticcacaulis excentricus (strain ATCC 15261 / DSM 4724 / KCTC 12464 / NCIMB 9791 / VKM B-1370 / CB 48) TaxID=573065 RepID=E8RN85_ASTEC|nr:TraB/GumN family protein [Asticcacaulis excentricus]ADU13984.1 GumN family protein [Asticcacaulis excentricus CB 48]